MFMETNEKFLKMLHCCIIFTFQTYCLKYYISVLFKLSRYMHINIFYKHKYLRIFKRLNTILLLLFYFYIEDENIPNILY